MNALQRALAEGVVKVKNKMTGEVMVRVSRPDPEKPGRAKMVSILIAGGARKDLTKEATVAELKRSSTLVQMTSPPTNILEVLPKDADV